MFHIVPDALARDHRGMCPTCGSVIELSAADETRCGLCGGESVLEHRAREIDADTGRPGDASAWTDLRVDRPACPRCGAALAVEPDGAVLACAGCGTRSRLQARLSAVATDEIPMPRERTRIDFENRSRDRIDYPFDIETEQLFWRILNEPDLGRRVALCQKFQSWSYVNRTAVHFLPALLTHLGSDHDAVALAAGDVVGKLLCNEDASLWPGVLTACHRVLFDTAGKRTLLDEIALGTNVCVKLLIDVAEYAESEGDAEYASCALLGVNTLVARNYDDIPLIAAIVFYRLYDVTGIVLGWALNALKFGDLRARLPAGLTIPVIDDLGEERPRLVPHVLDCLFMGAPETKEEYVERLGLISGSKGWGGRAAGLEILGVPPVDDPKLWAEAVAAVDASLDHPDAGDSAEKALYALVCASKGATAKAVDDLVARRGEDLSYRVKREYIRRNPDTDLLDTEVQYYWQSEVERELDAETEACIQRYKDGLDAAISRRDEGMSEIRQLTDEARKLDVPLFLRDEPATIPVPDDRNLEIMEARRDAERDRVNDATDVIQSEYTTRIEALSAEMMRDMDDPAAVQRLSAEMMRLGEELQKNLEELHGE